MTPSQYAIEAECDAIKAMLIAKNLAYGDSALNPIRLFSKADASEQLKVRIDDKLSRLMRGKDAGEDVTADLIGYLILLRVQRRLFQSAGASGGAESPIHTCSIEHLYHFSC